MTAKQALGMVPAWLKVVLTVFALVFGVGVTFGQQWVGLPAQTTANALELEAAKIRITTLERSLDRIDSQYARLICLLALPEDARIRVASNPVALVQECSR